MMFWLALTTFVIVASTIFVRILWRATFITLHDGGITWRGTRYALAALKANRV